MGSRTKNADKRKRQGKTGSNTASRPLVGYRGGVKPIFDEKAAEAMQQASFAAAKDRAEAKANAKRIHRRVRAAAHLPPASEIKLTPIRETAKTPPKKREVAP